MFLLHSLSKFDELTTTLSLAQMYLNIYDLSLNGSMIICAWLLYSTPKTCSCTLYTYKENRESSFNFEYPWSRRNFRWRWRILSSDSVGSGYYKRTCGTDACTYLFEEASKAKFSLSIKERITWKFSVT